MQGYPFGYPFFLVLCLAIAFFNLCVSLNKLIK